MSSVSPPADGRRFTPMSEARGTHAAFLVVCFIVKSSVTSRLYRLFLVERLM